MTFEDLLLAARLATPKHNAAALCRELGVTRSTFYNWENWEKSGSLPAPDKISKLAEIAGVSVDAATFAVYAAKTKADEDISVVFQRHAALYESPIPAEVRRYFA